MSRRALSFIVGGLGIVVAFATLIGMSIMGSLQADARTESVAGPGVDVFLRTPFPLAGSEVILDVAARGGSKAGVQEVVIRDGADTLATTRGRGATWGSLIVENHGRGNDSSRLSFSLPSRLAEGDTLRLAVDVDYVVAMSSVSTFENERRHDVVQLDVPILSPSQRQLARLWLTARGLGVFVLWIGFVWGVAFLFITSTGPAGDGEMEGIGFLMGIMGGGMLGYWFFARPLMAAWELSATVFEVLLTALWIVLPIWWIWRWHKRRPKLHPFRLGGGVEIDARDLQTWLRAAGGIELRERGQALTARRGKMRMELRWNAQRLPIEELVITATDARLPLELAHRAAVRLGKPLILSPSSGPSLTVDPGRSVDQIEQEYSKALLAETERILAALRASPIFRRR